MRRLVVSTALGALVLSLAISICFGGPWGAMVSVNARFVNWPIVEKVIHVIGTLDNPSIPFEGGKVAIVGRGSPILFGFEYADPMDVLIEIKEDPHHHVRLRIDGAIVADNLESFLQDPFVAEPGVGPDWTWDHDGDGLGDGNGNGIGDWTGPVMFWRFEIKPKLDFGDHTWQLEVTTDDWTTWWISNGILRIAE